jgi:hypothetical protein
MAARADDLRHIGVFVAFGVEGAEDCDGGHKNGDGLERKGSRMATLEMRPQPTSNYPKSSTGITIAISKAAIV